MGQNIADRLLLDSTVLIDLSRRRKEAIDYIDSVRKNDHEPAISMISSMELIIDVVTKPRSIRH